MISYTKETADPSRPWRFARGFLTADTESVDRLAQGISQYVWSGIVWKDGIRSEDQFAFSDWCVLDFEDPDYSLSQALRDFCDCRHIIGTTKSHRVAKGRFPPIDRFRVMVPWEKRITDLATYRFNMKRLVDVYPMDKVCCDGARYFFPCKDIISRADDGYRQQVFPLPPRRHQTRQRRLGLVPQWAKAQLTKTVPEGERSITFHRVAKDLYRAGHTPQEVLGMIIQSKTYGGKPAPHALMKLQEAIRSAVKAVDKEERT